MTFLERLSLRPAFLRSKTFDSFPSKYTPGFTLVDNHENPAVYFYTTDIFNVPKLLLKIIY